MGSKDCPLMEQFVTWCVNASIERLYLISFLSLGVCRSGDFPKP